MASLEDTQELVQGLCASWLLAAASPDMCRQLCASGVLRSYAAGAVLMQEGEESGDAILVLSGSLRIWRCGSRDAVRTFRLAKPGDLVGEIGLIRNSSRSATVTAQEDTSVLAISRDAFRSLVRAHPEFALGVMDVLCKRLEASNHAWEMSQAYGTNARVASLLLHLWHDFPLEQDGRRCIAVRLSHLEMASMLGIARENVTRALTRLRRAGAIAIDGGRIEILDADELQSWVC